MNPQLQIMLQQGIQAFQSGNFDAANLILNEVLQKDINSADTIFELGIAYAKVNRFMEASAIFCCLQPYKNNDVRISYNLGLIYSLQGKHQLALEAYELALKIQPDDAEVLINKGSTCNDIKDYGCALDALDRAIQLRPDIPEAWLNKGIALSNLSLYLESIEAYNEAIKLAPGFHEAWSNVSVPLNKLKRFVEASEVCDKALSLKPDYAEAWSNKGVALNSLNLYEQAVSAYNEAIKLNPNWHEVWSNISVPLNKLMRFSEAADACDKALNLKPDYAEAWSNKGVTLNELRRFDEAITHYDQALKLKPDYAEAWSNKGVTLNELRRFDEAITHYDQALNINRNIDWVFGNLLHLKMKICNWKDFSHSLKYLSEKVMMGQKVAQPFLLLSLTGDGFLQKKASEIYVQNVCPKNSILGPIARRSYSEKIRIGYFSADFRSHAVSFLTAELFELHDKNRFEIIAFSFGEDDKSEIRSRLINSFDQFIDVRNFSDLEIAKLARDLQVDIAVDLGGYTNDSRVGVFSYRAAPLQIGYLGYLGTTGAEYYDYLLADSTIVPKDMQKFYAEKIIYLPSYQVNDRNRILSKKQFSRQELGLPGQGFVFCCLNNNYKILPAIFDSWMRILNAVQGSVLFLYADNEWSKANLLNEAKIRGIDSGRLIFGKRIPVDEYLARYRACDLFLDTAPYNAGTTASDALWVGLPVLTLLGSSFAGRMAASLLNAIDLQELIAYSQEEYERLAIELALNPMKFAEIKSRLAQNHLSAPLFNTPFFTKNLEMAYSKIYESYLAGKEPDHIFI